MNIKALIKKYEELWNEHSPFYEPVPYTSMVELFLKELKQLDEPKPVKVPQFVADWIDYFKKTGDWDLFQAMDYLFGKKEIREWLEYKNNQDLFARAWLDDYDIQKTKYVVTDGNHLYFKNYQEDIEIVILVDEQPGTMDYVKKFDTREGAQKAADILGWKVQEVKDET
ncbi:hypothetical protein BMJ42_00105 [Streptococcus pneumoniae]|uniref:DUF1642 domain-containing protein n=1 Tax=Streptococcus pneumoniae TaxID=1313 RepID=UPI0005DD36CA|nr:DUF1642 domain-containing protein [Streptococcus pneumoniae]APJ29447.1 hypothetical protein BMJ42_00105 [Streptococcus pneumoniae]MDV8802188.1 DUF1642 domain-containing protein [Streptococcus pneumoniae]CMW33578.1 Protein of uncharacterised function (DUF1642) [Streptococcus pneumoniae]VMM17206.1 Protein of uncharacterised function (DUF1642) [Streptococcus pneumoniae]VNK53967.1 Protein of uncharacterised function (DUF1642) [Streptococcus pneumoniae]